MAIWNVIQHSNISTNTTAFEVTSIPQTYEHLFLFYHIRSGTTGPSQSAVTFASLQVGGDGSLNTSANYSQIFEYGVTSSAGMSKSHSATSWQNLYIAPYHSTYAIGWLWIPGYRRADRYKQLLARNNYTGYSSSNGTFGNQIYAGLLKDTDPITNLKLYHASHTFGDHSTISLYGIGNTNS